jgi:uncharacterized delta-60 repeat protein
MRLLKTTLLFALLFALVADGAAASPSAGLDPSFGNGGKVAVPATAGLYGYARIQGMAVGPEGRVYVLEESTVLAFETDGTPAAGFGVNGQVSVAPRGGEGSAAALAVDSMGRVLVAGSVGLGDQTREGHRISSAPIDAAYVIRLLPSGARDMSFGGSGEVQTAFGLPRPEASHGRKYAQASAIATSIIVDSQDRPVVGGGYAKSYAGCESAISPDPFVGRLTVDGTIDKTFAGGGYGLIGGHGEVSALALTPEGGPATLSYGVSCGARSEDQPSRFTAFAEDGEAAPTLDRRRPQFYMDREMAIDPEGRILVVQTPPPVGEGPASLVRLLPSGDIDRSFGKKGGVVLKGALSGGSVFTVDTQSRPILTTGEKELELRRLDENGAIDRGFGPGGRLFTHATYAQAITLDGEGRIYTAGVVGGTKRNADSGVQVVRFLPES